jgi:uncharacterized coiled-coil DUF342 family protein
MPTAEIEPAGWYEQRIDALIRSSRELVAEIGRLRASNDQLAQALTAANAGRERLRAEVQELRTRIGERGV